MEWWLQEKYLKDDPNLYYDGYLDYGKEYILKDFINELEVYSEIENLRYEICGYTDKEIEFIRYRGRNEATNIYDELDNFLYYNDIIIDTYTYVYGIEPYLSEDIKQYFIEGSFLDDGKRYLSFLKNLRKGLMTKRNLSRFSKGEKLLNEILKNKGYKFEREYSDGCINPETFYSLPFDFIIYVNDIKIYVEVQGGQHYKPINFDNNKEVNEDNFKRLKQRDMIKKHFAEKNGIFIELDYKEGDVNKLEKRIYDELIPLLENLRGGKSDK